MKWAPELHHLFPPSFQHGVKHLFGVKVALDADDDRGFPEPIWMMIISFLLRDWDFNLYSLQSEMQSEEIRIATDGEQYALTEFNTCYGDDAQWHWDQADPDETD